MGRNVTFAMLSAFVAVFLLIGCKTKYLPVEKVVYRNVEKYITDTLWNTDSVWIHDSVLVRQKGDTIFQDRWHTKLKYQYIYKVKTDTLITRDTIKVSADDGKYKDALVTIRLDKYGVATLAFCLALLIFWIYKRLRK